MSLTVFLTATLLAFSEPPADKGEEANRIETGVIAETIAIEAEPALADGIVDDRKSGDVSRAGTKPQTSPADEQED